MASTVSRQRPMANALPSLKTQVGQMKSSVSSLSMSSGETHTFRISQCKRSYTLSCEFYCCTQSSFFIPSFPCTLGSTCHSLGPKDRRTHFVRMLWPRVLLAALFASFPKVTFALIGSCLRFNFHACSDNTRFTSTIPRECHTMTAHVQGSTQFRILRGRFETEIWSDGMSSKQLVLIDKSAAGESFFVVFDCDPFVLKNIA